jgi:hypothetical protein
MNTNSSLCVSRSTSLSSMVCAAAGSADGEALLDEVEVLRRFTDMNVLRSRRGDLSSAPLSPPDDREDAAAHEDDEEDAEELVVAVAVAVVVVVEEEVEGDEAEEGPDEAFATEDDDGTAAEVDESAGDPAAESCEACALSFLSSALAGEMGPCSVGSAELSRFTSRDTSLPSRQSKVAKRDTLPCTSAGEAHGEFGNSWTS